MRLLHSAHHGLQSGPAADVCRAARTVRHAVRLPAAVHVNVWLPATAEHGVLFTFFVYDFSICCADSVVQIPARADANVWLPATADATSIRLPDDAAAAATGPANDAAWNGNDAAWYAAGYAAGYATPAPAPAYDGVPSGCSPSPSPAAWYDGIPCRYAPSPAAANVKAALFSGATGRQLFFPCRSLMCHSAFIIITNPNQTKTVETLKILYICIPSSAMPQNTAVIVQAVAAFETGPRI
jgi:hypothetical protein